jgi:hypothetical protein
MRRMLQAPEILSTADMLRRKELFLSHPAEWEVVKLPNLYVFVLIIREGRGEAPLPLCKFDE